MKVSQGRNPFRPYLKTWLSLTAVALSAVGLFNLAVDPFRAYRLAFGGRLDAYKSKMNTRTAKAELLQHDACNVLLLGSSRAEMGVDPLLPDWGARRVYNLALEGTNLYETTYVLRYALRSGEVKKVILFADFLMFTESRTVGGDFEKSRFNPERNVVEYHLDNVLSMYATKCSFRALKDCAQGKRTQMRPHGNIIISRAMKAVDHQAAMEKVIGRFLADPQTYGSYVYGPSRISLFGEMVRRCRDRGVELMVVILPVHALQLEAIRAAGLWETFETWKTDMVNSLADDADAHRRAKPFVLWDFTGYSGIVAEPVPAKGQTTVRMKWFWESSHFKKKLGDLAICRILAQAPPGGEMPDDFGVKLTPANIASHLARIRANREAYARKHPEHIQMVQKLAREARAKR
ncbi:MAG: hypothetical protein SVT52_09550 [Planctomycetota bacterium]|nr:hypothetical protein [Planctomycetota bacterium]